MRKLRRLEGLPVVDAMKPRWFKIGNEDIQYAIRKNGDYCAAAMALCRDDAIEDAFVYRGRTYIRYHNRWVRYMTSPQLRKALEEFDKKGVFDPGTYRLGAPTPTARLGCGYQTEYSRTYNPPAGKTIVHKVKGVRPQAPRIVGDMRIDTDDLSASGRRT